jgi:predicted DNA-binding transcriptional regulator YafY
MTKKRTAPRSRTESTTPVALTPERFTRLCQLVRYLASASRTRDQITRHLKLDLRGFYRDLELLRSVGVPLTLAQGQYLLGENADSALARLPFPDPHFTLGEALQLARGRTRAHQRFRERIEELLG